MTEIRKEIHAVASSSDLWRESARGVMNDGWDIDTEVELQSERIISGILCGFTTLFELRGGVQWANALDREAVEVYGSDIRVGAQQLERTSRRVMHHAGSKALKQVKTESRMHRLVAFRHCTTN